MSRRFRPGCLVLFLLGLLPLLLWRPLARWGADWMFDRTQDAIVAALPGEERADAVALCEALWGTIRTRGIAREHANAYRDFQRFVWGVLKNQEVTPDEAAEFLARARALLATLDPTSPLVAGPEPRASTPRHPPGVDGSR